MKAMASPVVVDGKNICGERDCIGLGKSENHQELKFDNIAKEVGIGSS